MKLHTIKLQLKQAFRKKTKAEKETEVRVELDLLRDDLSARIFQETERLRSLHRQNETDVRAEQRIKNAYNALYVLTQAKADLKNVRSDADLAKVINRAGKVLSRLNISADFSPKIGARFFKWQAEAVKGRIDEGGTELKIPYAENVNITDTIVDRLLKGTPVSMCIDQDMTHSTTTAVEDLSVDTSVTLDSMPASSGNTVQEDYEEIIRKLQKQDMI